MTGAQSRERRRWSAGLQLALQVALLPLLLVSSEFLFRGWVAAADLRVGDDLSGVAGETLFVVNHEVRAQDADHYNFEVEGWHTYFVAASATAPAVWAHNKCRLTGPQALAAAKKLGYRKVDGQLSHKQPIFTNGKNFISPDADVHSGGVWKMAKKMKNLYAKETRGGTYDANLKRIGD